MVLRMNFKEGGCHGATDWAVLKSNQGSEKQCQAHTDPYCFKQPPEITSYKHLGFVLSAISITVLKIQAQTS